MVSRASSLMQSRKEAEAEVEEAEDHVAPGKLVTGRRLGRRLCCRRRVASSFVRFKMNVCRWLRRLLPRCQALYFVCNWLSKLQAPSSTSSKLRLNRWLATGVTCRPSVAPPAASSQQPAQHRQPKSQRHLQIFCFPCPIISHIGERRRQRRRPRRRRQRNTAGASQPKNKDRRKK